MPQINLLPWREGLRKERQKQFMVAAAAGAVLGLGLTLIMSWTMSRFIDHQIARNGYLHEQIAIVDQQIEEISDLEAKKERLLARMEIIEQLQRSRPEVVHLVDELVRTVPEGVYLS
ncbi:MAG: pilus assembly protein PilN, partial [Gammaproteobacteria bacterium]